MFSCTYNYFYQIDNKAIKLRTRQQISNKKALNLFLRFIRLRWSGYASVT